MVLKYENEGFASRKGGDTGPENSKLKLETPNPEWYRPSAAAFFQGFLPGFREIFRLDWFERLRRSSKFRRSVLRLEQALRPSALAYGPRRV